MAKKTERRKPKGPGKEPFGTDHPKAKAKAKKQEVVISAPNFQTATFVIIGTAPLVGNKFSKRAFEEMKAKQEAGSTGRKGAKRSAKDFKKCYEEATHRDAKGWAGIPAPAFRNACISACAIVGFHMTKGKKAIFCLADGVDCDDGTPLVKITKGKPHYAEHFVKNETGVCDIRPRPRWDLGWEATVRIQFDADMFTLVDIGNLLNRAGVQVGIGAGRPDSSKSNGMGWGTFTLKGKGTVR